MFDLSGSRVWVAGHRGMVGSAIWRALEAHGARDLIGWSSAELDLTDRGATIAAAREARPDVVVVAAAKVGGIGANSADPVGFLQDNVRIQTNVMEAAHLADVDRLLFLGSSCIYPRLAPQPLEPSSLMTGPLEPTNDGYAIAKIAGLVHVQGHRRQFGRRWISAMPTNLYGPGDDFDLESAHVLPALIHRFERARREDAEAVTLWGSGTPRREFLYVDDMAAASVFVMNLPKATLDAHTQPMQSQINVGFGDDITIKELALAVGKTVGYQGVIDFDTSKPDGSPRKLMDSSRLNALGWQPQVGLEAGLADTYQDFIARTTT